MYLIFSTMYRVPRALTLHWNIQGASSMKFKFFLSFMAASQVPSYSEGLLDQKEEGSRSGHSFQEVNLCVLSQR